MKKRSLKTANRFIAFIKVFVIVAIASKPSSVLAQGLVFKDPLLISGTDKSDGAVYRFSNVADKVDALLTISGRSSSKVKLSNIDLTNTGWDKAFQPQISYNTNGDASGSSDWWMDFDISFVTSNAAVPVVVSNFNVTAIDIDGDGKHLREYVALKGLKSYTVENRSALSISDLLELVTGLLTPTGKKFDGSLTDYANIDTNATKVMVTATYQNKSQFRIRAGGTSTSSSVSANRMYSFWFKSFSYQAPVQGSLPITLSAFTAKKAGSSVALNWSTEMEKNVSHYVVERSTNGTDFADAGLIFTAESNSSVHKEYSFNDDVKNVSAGLLYYRLRIVDLDGRYEQSAIRIIRTDEEKERTKILVYPNPVVSNVLITLPAVWQDKQVSVQVINTNGLVVKNLTDARAGQTENMNVAGLPPGLYIVKVTSGKETTVQQLVKMK